MGRARHCLARHRVCRARSATQQQQQIQYGEQPGAAQRTTLLLRDFQPRSMLHVAVHTVERARFPVWDVHNHVDDASRIGERIPPDQVVSSMDQVNVAKMRDSLPAVGARSCNRCSTTPSNAIRIVSSCSPSSITAK